MFGSRAYHDMMHFWMPRKERAGKSKNERDERAWGGRRSR